jgi:methylene-tetrahydromethanopterin dehydrogenase
MVPPFEISVFADPSGGFTTAAALVGCVEKQLKAVHGKELKDCKAVVFGGTGPVGIATGVIASLAGADTALVDHLSIDTAEDVAKEYNRRFACNLKGAVAGSDADKARLVADVDIIFCTAKAGIQVLSAAVLSEAKQLKVAGDVNAVPPLGIEGIKRSDSGQPLIYAINAQGAVGVGALAIGNVKYQLQHSLLQAMLTSDKPVYLDFRDAFNKAREIL